jgi:hypothetical protein
MANGSMLTLVEPCTPSVLQFLPQVRFLFSQLLLLFSTLALHAKLGNLAMRDFQYQGQHSPEIVRRLNEALLREYFSPDAPFVMRCCGTVQIFNQYWEDLNQLQHPKMTESYLGQPII